MAAVVTMVAVASVLLGVALVAPRSAQAFRAQPRATTQHRLVLSMVRVSRYCRTDADVYTLVTSIVVNDDGRQMSWGGES
jgi:hypothetical protein